jgi:short subunit dehydrogenase-like uncharacterized protein
MRQSSIVVFGATGYTGELTARALCQLGIRPVLAGRNEIKLKLLSRSLGDLVYRLADVSDPASMSRLAEAGEIVISTVGPYSRYGRPVIAAAVGARAHYLDVTGEIAFSRLVIDEYGEQARRDGITIQTASGYDYVPGHCAAAVALRRAGERAARVDIGYFASGPGGLKLSHGTMLSIAEVALERGVFFREGQLVEGEAGQSVRVFSLGDKRREAISVSTTEHLFLPRHYPGLRQINVYLGWFGAASRLAPPAAMALAALRRVPGAIPTLRRALGTLVQSGGVGPDEAERSRQGSQIVAVASDAGGAPLARAELRGVHGYTFTARIVALLAQGVALGRIRGAGVVDPIDALGVEGLVEACAKAGLELL